MEAVSGFHALAVVSLPLLVFVCSYFAYTFVYKPIRAIHFLRSQGLQGLPFRPVFGNVIELREVNQREVERCLSSTASVFSFFDFYAKKFGCRAFYYFRQAPSCVV
eukprot:TRINITY_DN3880_c0_g3_i1.p2 TRINITY_DN3880_c0_g3~~TRINITY_DN3880_c0_g3_i1.p2  ORF type:complete len:106 (+),score=2.13 TRINITY_DN3880_c0_g3_i1:691-1008(+)